MATLGSHPQVKVSYCFQNRFNIFSMLRVHVVQQLGESSQLIVLSYDSLQVLSNVHHIHQCTHHEKLIPTTKASYPSNQKVVHYDFYLIAQIHESIVNNLSTYKEPMTCIFQVIYNVRDMVDCSNQCQYTKRIARRQLSLTLLHHILLLRAQS